MKLPYYKDHPHWKEFFGPKEAQTLEGIVQEKWITSTGTKIHLDIYEHSKKSPTIIYCHGLASCGRIMGHFALNLYKQGYNVICPDLVGFGLTTKKLGSGSIPDYIKNLLDTITYAKRRFTGPRYLSGISLGGSLSYYTACHEADVNAIACYCLVDLSSSETHDITQTGRRVIWTLIQLAKLGSLILPNLHIPMKHFLSLDTLSSHQAFNEVFRTNPLAVKIKTFRAGYSLVTTPPHIPFEEFEDLPVLVIHGEKDRMIPEELSRKNYERIVGEKKYVCIKDCEHVPIDPKHMQEYIKAMDTWFKKFA